MNEDQNLSIINELLPILTSGNTGVWECDKSAEILDFRNDFFKILDLTRWNIEFSTLSELRSLIHSDDVQTFEDAFAATSKGKTVPAIYRCCTSDGNHVQMETTFMPCNSNGIIALTVNKDLTLQLSRLEKQCKTVVNSLFPNFIFVFDANFHFIDIITPDGLRLFHNNDELIGVDARKFYAPEVSDLFVTNIQECLKNNQWKEIEYHLDVDSTRYYYQARIVPVDGDKTLCLIQDIGDRVRRMEELLIQRRRAEESDKMKSVFIANMSQEIITPLNAIIDFSEHLMTEEMPLKRQKYMDIIRSSTDLLLQIVNDILDLSRLEAGMGNFHFEDTDIAALVIDVAEEYMSEMKPDVRFLIDAPCGNIQAPTDANRVKQVFSILINNAVKYTGKGSITLKVDEGNDYLTFSIIDTGCGMPENMLEIISNYFEKTNRLVQGAIRGLAISKSIVDQLGGNITVSSKINEGSIFSFTIPYRAPKKQNIGSMRELVAKQRKKILLAESSENDLQYVSNLLEKKYDVLEVIEYERIISAFILDNPNLVLISMEMVGKTDIIKKIRAISTSIPIIVMTTSDFYHDQRWAIENGCTDVIYKPFSSSNIEELITTFIV